MALATVVDHQNNHHLHLESLPLIDLRLLSQSELYSLSLTSYSSSFHILKPFSSLKTTEHGGNPNAAKPSHKSKPPSAPWLNKWPNRNPPADFSRQKINDKVKVKDSYGRDQTIKANTANTTRYFDKDKGQSAIERIVFRLRNLGLGSDDEEEEEGDDGIGLDGQDSMPSGEEKLGDLLQREWVRPPPPLPIRALLPLPHLVFLPMA